MAERIQLNEMEMEKVIGGAFNFYTNSKGQEKCVVDGVGTYYVSSNAFDWIVSRTAGEGGNDPASMIVDEAIAAGYFWE